MARTRMTERPTTRDLLDSLARRLAASRPDAVAALVEWLLQAIDCYAGDRGPAAEQDFENALISISSDIRDRIESGMWFC